MGSLVAFEMAKQFNEEGDTTGLLAMVDTHLPEMEKNTEVPMLVRFAASISRQMGIDTRTLGQRFLQLGADEQWNLVLQTLIHEGAVAPNTARAQMTTMVEVFTQNSAAFENYFMEKSPQRVVLFRASEVENHRDLANEWSKWAGGGVDFLLVSGNHYTMIRQPHVSAIAGPLKGYLVAVENRGNTAKAGLVTQ
jgi:thioesterase domain-containing protein